VSQTSEIVLLGAGIGGFAAVGAKRLRDDQKCLDLSDGTSPNCDYPVIEAGSELVGIKKPAARAGTDRIVAAYRLLSLIGHTF